MSTKTKQPARPRYEVQTRSGTEWSWYAGSDDNAKAARLLREAKHVGHNARLWDTKIGARVHPSYDRVGELQLVTVPA